MSESLERWIQAGRRIGSRAA